MTHAARSAQLQFDDASQVTVKVSSGDAVDPTQLDAYTQKLAAACVKALG
jgi:hypothetical protein